MNRFFTSFFITLLLLVQLAQNVYAEDNNLNDETDNTNLEEVVDTDSDEKEKNIRLEENVNEKNYDYNKYKIDFSKIKDRWIDLNNKLRDSIGEEEYSYNDKLDKTAQEWAEVMERRGEASHKRNSGDSYYNYKKITSWFENRGIEFENINRATFSESIGYGNYNCNGDDCTEQISDSVKRVYDRYMEEKNKKYQPHYRALIKEEFRKIGLGIAIKELGKGKYEFYLTVHYGTDIL